MKNFCYKYILAFFVLLISVAFAYYEFFYKKDDDDKDKIKEKFSSSPLDAKEIKKLKEILSSGVYDGNALQNITSIFNSDQIIVDNLHITDNLQVKGDIITNTLNVGDKTNPVLAINEDVINFNKELNVLDKLTIPGADKGGSLEIGNSILSNSAKMLEIGGGGSSLSLYGTAYLKYINGVAPNGGGGWPVTVTGPLYYQNSLTKG